MIAARRDYAPYAEIRSEAATDMYSGGLPVKGNWVQFSVDEADESVLQAEVGEWNGKRRVEYATRAEDGIEFSGYTAVTNIQYMTSKDYYEWNEDPLGAVEFNWTGTPGVPANLQAETFDIGVPSPSGKAIDSVSESVAMPGEVLGDEKRVIVSAKVGAQEARQSRTQTENTAESHEAKVSISSLQKQTVRTIRAKGSVDDKAVGSIEIGSGVGSPYFNVDMGMLETGAELSKDILGADLTPVTLEWIKETGTVSSPSARFAVVIKGKSTVKKVPNWYYEQVGKRSPTVSGVVCQCAARVTDSTLGIIMYCPNSTTQEIDGTTTYDLLGPGTIQYGWGVPGYTYAKGEEPQNVDGAKLLGRRNASVAWTDDSKARWWNGGDWQTLYEVIDVQGGTGTSKIAYPASISKHDGTAGLPVSFNSTTWMRYYFPYVDEEEEAHEFKVGPVACYQSSYSTERISAYTIAQAGNTEETADGSHLLRQAKEVFPSRILRISAHTETDEGCRSMNGLSTSNLNAEYTQHGLNEKSDSAVPRALLTTTHDCSSRLMASFAVDTNISSTLSLPSAVSASVIHDDGGSISAAFRLTGWGTDEEQHWPGEDFGYSLTTGGMAYLDDEGENYGFAGAMSTLVRNNKETGTLTNIDQLPTYVVRGAMKDSGRSTLFSQTAYLLDDVPDSFGK